MSTFIYKSMLIIRKTLLVMAFGEPVFSNNKIVL